MITARMIGTQIHQSVANPTRLSAYSPNPALLNADTAWNTPRYRARGERLAVAQREPGRQHRGGHGLHHGADHRDPEQDRADIPQADAVGFRRRGQPGPQPHPAGHHQAQQGGQRHDPETADLDQTQDHRLTESGPVGSGIDHRQTRDTHRACRGEQRLHEPCPARPGPRDRQHQQTGAHDNPGQERPGNRLPGMPHPRPPPATTTGRGHRRVTDVTSRPYKLK